MNRNSTPWRVRAAALVVTAGCISHPSMREPVPAPDTGTQDPTPRDLAAPLYWTQYEYDYLHDDYIPESVWQAGVDWVAATFASSGYDMVVTDGWIYGDAAVNADGYITKYNNTWAHDFAYWSSYSAQHGLKLGIYYNPLWIQQSAYDQNNLIAGTTYTIQSIAGVDRAPNSKFEKWWLDPTKPGAKEYVQGYVRYFRSIGVKFLRLDFLTEFETQFGTALYDQALSWVREAAGDDMFISLVMPNGYNMAQTEIKYGNMMRVSEDTFDGTWGAVSDRYRGTLFPQWPVARNAFDGFTHFSPVSGRGGMVLDGDAIRLNTLANDTERVTCVSLYTMAGSAIPIADQPGTIGASAWIYTNAELLALSKLGFAGKPLSPVVNSPDSQRWAGQTPNGDWIIGLFNRESSTQTRGVDYASELGVAQPAATRDLWSHTDLGARKSYSDSLVAHGSRVLKIATGQWKFEAEVAAMIGGAAFNNNHTGASAFGFVDQLTAQGAAVHFDVDRGSSTANQLLIWYADGGTIDKTATVRVNGQPAQVVFPRTTDWNTWGAVTITVALHDGINQIAVEVDPGDTGGFNLDYIELR